MLLGGFWGAACRCGAAEVRRVYAGRGALCHAQHGLASLRQGAAGASAELRGEGREAVLERARAVCSGSLSGGERTSAGRGPRQLASHSGRPMSGVQPPCPALCERVGIGVSGSVFTALLVFLSFLVSALVLVLLANLQPCRGPLLKAALHWDGALASGARKRLAPIQQGGVQWIIGGHAAKGVCNVACGCAAGEGACVWPAATRPRQGRWMCRPMLAQALQGLLMPAQRHCKGFSQRQGHRGARARVTRPQRRTSTRDKATEAHEHA